ncbi:sugar transferase [Nakamurella deserti]|uniref:sugar transferase n=1 Tax=Nakamurella deserti TaxID=2164074 RepID=UPI000DBE96F2|nr:sugar transferase [Nakamurella deserti]
MQNSAGTTTAMTGEPRTGGVPSPDSSSAPAVDTTTALLPAGVVAEIGLGPADLPPVPQRRLGERDYVGNTSGSVKRMPFGQRRQQDWINTYQRNLVFTDLAILLVMTVVGHVTRLDVIRTFDASGADWALSFALVALWGLALGARGAYEKNVLGNGAGEYHRVAQATFLLFGTVGTICYLAQLDLTRSYLLTTLPLGVVGLFVGRAVWRWKLAAHRRSGTHLNTVLVVGSPKGAVDLAQRLDASPAAGFRVVGLCVPQDRIPPGTSSLDGFKVSGHLAYLMQTIQRSKINTIAVAGGEDFGPAQVRDLAWKLEGTGIKLALAPALTDVAGPRIHIRPVDGLPLMMVQEPRYRGPRLYTKTVLDIMTSAVALVLLSPVLLAVAAAIKITDPGPVFFRHTRVGMGGRRFKVWKFRSMRVDADAQIDAVKAAAGQAGNTFYKSADDPRISRIGAFLRKTSLDELPQLFNVISGQMSIVGPRPLVPGEGADVGSFVERRMLVRPGMTGLWQVSGRSDASADERIRLDFYYIENWSVVSDLVIMAKTVKAVLAGSGAY